VHDLHVLAMRSFGRALFPHPPCLDATDPNKIFSHDLRSLFLDNKRTIFCWALFNSITQGEGSVYNPPMPEAPPQVMAKILHHTLVIERSSDHLVKTLQIPEPFIQRFREKVALYREAVILMRLVAESKQEDRFASVQCAYEAILFGPVPAREGLGKLKTIRAAMTDLNKVVSTQEKSRCISWAREWFVTIGYDAANPITNFLLANMWMQEFIGTAKAIRECLTALP
jgi:hypothetical protein